MWLRALLAIGCLLCGLGLGRAAEPLRAPIDVSDQSAPTFRLYTAEDGLSDEIWSTIGVDRAGFVWAGSASGLARFDGYRWHQRQLPQARSLVRDMETSADGTLWALFEREGLLQYDGRDWQVETQVRGGSHRFIQVHRPGGERELWLANHSAGFLRWRDGIWEAPLRQVPMPAGNAISIEQTERLHGSPRQWMGTSEGGLWWRDSTRADAPWQRYSHPVIDAMLTTHLLRSEERGVEELWVPSYNGGLARIRPDGVRIWRAATGELPTEAIYSVQATYASDGTSSLWLASRAGLLRIRGDQITTFDRRHGLPSDAVRGIKLSRTVDGIDVLWLATEGGVARLALTESPWLTVSLLGANNNGTFGVLLEPDGNGGERLWVGSSTQGLGLLQGAQWRYFGQADGSLPGDGVRAIWRLPGPDGHPWRLLSMQGSGELLRIADDLSMTPIEVPWLGKLDHTASDALARYGPDGHEFWFGNLRGGVHRLQQGRWTQFLADGASAPWTAIRLAEQIDSSGRSWLWAASDQGLARFDGERWQLLADSVGLPADIYRSVTVRFDGHRTVLWLGTQRHGVQRLDVTEPMAPRLIEQPELPAVPDPTVYSVLFDSRGRIYICTNNGVQQLTPLTEERYASRVHTRSDGMVHDECNTNSQHIDGRDRYWVGTLGGLSVLDPDVQPSISRSHPKPLRVSQIVVDGTVYPFAPEQPLILPAGSRELRLSYTLLVGLREEDSRYRSQLIGYDPQVSDWSAQRERGYTGLPPGPYVFRIEARDYAGTASVPLNVDFLIEPHWWQIPLVRWALALVMIALLLASVLLYNRNLRQRQRLLRALVSERTTELRLANERLTELSYLDPLTGVANRRRLTEALDAALDRAKAQGRPIGLIVVDVDLFKDYNDRHGHLAGDIALRAVAQALASATRRQDLIARFGGEEFACLLIDADVDTVSRIAERMRALVEALPPRTLGNDSQTITVSAGVCSRVPAADESAADLLRDADAALYQAKHEGRNCVRVGRPAGAVRASD